MKRGSLVKSVFDLEKESLIIPLVTPNLPHLGNILRRI